MTIQNLVDQGSFSLDTPSTEPTLYDADSPYIGDLGYRFNAIDAPEMPSTEDKSKLTALAKKKQEKLISLNLLKPEKVVNTVRLATPGERAKLEAQLLEVDPVKTPLKGLGDTLTVFDDTKTQPEQISTGVENLGEYNPNQRYDKYGRVLLNNPEFQKEMVEKGYAVPTFEAGDELLGSGKKAQESSVGLWGDAPKAMETLANKRGVSELLGVKEPETAVDDGRFLEMVDALQYGLGKKAAGIVDWAVDTGLQVATEVGKWKTDKSEKDINRAMKQASKGTFLDKFVDKDMNFTGLDKYKEAVEYGYANTRTKEVLDNVGEEWDQKDWVGLGGAVLEGIYTAGPEFLLESSGEIVTGVFGKLGLVLNSGDYTNQILDERKEIVGELGIKDRIIASSAGLGMGILNKLGADELIGKTQVAKNALKVLSTSGTKKDLNALRKLLKTTAKATALVGAKGSYEGLEEIAQEALNVVGEKYGTKEQDKIISSATGKQLAQAFAGGFAAGGVSPAISEAKQASKDAVVGSVKAAKAVKKKTQKPKTEEQKKAEAILEEEKKTGIDVVDSHMKDVDKTIRTEPNKAGQSLYKAALELDKIEATLKPGIAEQYRTRIEDRRKRVRDKILAKKEEVLDKKNPEAIKALGSDEDAVAELGLMLRESDNIENTETVESLKEVAKTLGIDSKKLVDLRDKILKERKTLDTAIKTLEQVEGEVVTGPKGYKTYYEAMKAAEAAGDKETAAEYRTKLESFKEGQQFKVNRLKSGLVDIEQDVRRKVQEHAKAKGVSVERAALELSRSRNTVIKIDYSDTGARPFEVNSVDVYKNIVSSKRNGVYKTIDAIDQSIKAMDTLTKVEEVVAEPEVIVTSKEPEVITPPTKEEISVSKIKEPSIESIEDKVASGKELNPEERKTMALETAKKLYTGKKLSKLEEQVRATYPQDVEKVLKRKAELDTKKEDEKAEKLEIDFDKELEILDEQYVDMKDKQNIAADEMKTAEKRLQENPQDKEAKAIYREARRDLQQIIRERQAIINKRRQLVKTKRINTAENILKNSADKRALEMFEGSGKTVLTEYLTDDVKKTLDKDVRAISRILEEVLDNRTAPFLVDDSPFRILLNKKGKYSKEVLEAMAIVMNKFYGERYGELRFNDDTQIKKMLGLGSTGYVTPEMRRALKNIGRIESNEAAGLGRDIAKLLGIKAKSETDFDLQERFEVDAGATLLAAMEQLGRIERAETLDVPLIRYYADLGKGKDVTKPQKFDTRQKVVTIKMRNKKQWLDVAKHGKELFDLIDDQVGLGIAETKPRFSKKRKPTKHKTRNAEKWTELTEKQQEVLDTAENRPYEVDQNNVELLKEMWGEPTEDIEKLTTKQKKVAKLFGWSDADVMHTDLRDNVKAKNREVVESIQNLLEFAEIAQDRNIYFDYFFSKNGRFFIDSAKINPQTDKLHRFVISAQEDRDTKLVTDENRDNFKIGVVQAFDGSNLVANSTKDKEIKVGDEIIRDLGAIDKQSQKMNMVAFELLVTDPVVQEAINNPTSENVLKAIDGVDHPSHAMQALLALKKYKEDGDFYTEMTMETDAVTSGFILGMLTNPVMAWDNLKAWLAKGGVWFGDESYKSYGEWRQNNKDSYETGAQLASENLGPLIEENNAAWVTSIVGDINRKFMKGPFMVFMYGAGIGSIKKSISNTWAEETLKKLSDPNQSIETAMRIIEGLKQQEQAYQKNAGKILEKTVMKVLEVEGGTLTPGERVAAIFRGTSIEGSKPMNKALRVAFKTVESTVSKTYGDAIAEALGTEFEAIVENRKAMNNAFVGMYGAFKKEFDERVGKAQGNKNKPSKIDIDNTLEEMMTEGKIPGIMTVEATNQQEKAPILKTERVKAGTGSQVQIKTKPQRTVHPLVYEIAANPTAGAVVNIHYLDGAMIMKIIEDSIGTGVHDAYVMHVGRAVNTPKSYNEAVWKLTQEFNMMERIRDELVKAEKNVGKNVVRDSIWNNHIETFGEPEQTKQEMYDEVIETLDNSIQTIKRNKIKMVEEGATVAHMAGPDGSTYNVEGKSKADTDTINGIVNDIMNRCD